MEQDDARFLSSLYGGYWSYEVHDFCYMTNHYFPPEGLLDDIRGRLVELIKAYPSTNWYLSSLLGRTDRPEPPRLGSRQWCQRAH